MEREQLLAELQEADSFRPGDIEAEAELTFDADKSLENAPEGTTFASQGGFEGVGEYFGALRDQDWLLHNRVDEYRQRAQRFGALLDQDDMGYGEFRDPDFEVTADMVLDTADQYGLDERFFGRLASAQSAGDLDAIASAYGERQQREHLIAASAPPALGFLARVGVNVVDPAFVAVGGPASSVVRIGTAPTRLGRAMQGGAVGLVADTPVETTRVLTNPEATPLQAMIAVGGSVALGGAIGSLGRGLRSKDVEEMDQALANAYEGGSSVGAAQARPVLRETSDGVEVEGAPPQLEARIPGTRLGMPVFGTPLNYLERSTDAITRAVAATLSWNPFSAGTQRQTAFEAQRRINESGGAFLRPHRQNAAKYFQERGDLSPTGSPSTEQMQEFNRLVTMAQSGAIRSDNAHVNASARNFDEAYADTLQYVKNEHYNGSDATAGQGRGLEEFADVEAEKGWHTRMFDRDGFQRVLNQLGGVRQVGQRLARTVYRSNPEWLEEIAKKWNSRRSNTPDATGRVRPAMTSGEMAIRIATKYVETVQRLTNVAMDEQTPFRSMSSADREAAREVVREVMNKGDDFGDFTEDAMEMLLDLVAPVKKKSAESPRARPRMRLNLDAEQDSDIIDMFDWDAERLFMTYRRQISGFAGLLRSGYDSVAHLDKSIDQIGRNTVMSSGGRRNRAKGEQERLRVMRDMILGRRVRSEFDNDTYHFVTAQIRRMNFGNLMANVGFLAMSEVLGVMTRVGPIRLMQQLPAFRRYYKKAREGDPSAKAELFALSDTVMGHGSQQLRSRLIGNADRYEGDFETLHSSSGRLQERIDTFTRKQANATSRWSGMGPLSEWMRMSFATEETGAWLKAARKGGRVYEPRRMRALGVDDEMWNRISGQLRKMEDVQSPDTGQNVPFFDFSRWDDPEALNVFINAVDRNARRTVLEGDLGHQALVMRRSPAMQLMFQFMGFPLNAYSKHLGFGLNTHDMRGAAEVMAMSLGGSIGFMARTRAQAELLEDPEEREAFLEERWTTAEMAKSAAYYSAHASIIPNALDMGLSMASGMGAPVEPIFHFTRSSGLAGDPITGNPTYSRFETLRRVPSKFSEGTHGSADDVQHAIQASAPLAKHVILNAIIERALNATLPEETEDE